MQYNQATNRSSKASGSTATGVKTKKKTKPKPQSGFNLSQVIEEALEKVGSVRQTKITEVWVKPSGKYVCKTDSCFTRNEREGDQRVDLNKASNIKPITRHRTRQHVLIDSPNSRNKVILKSHSQETSKKKRQIKISVTKRKIRKKTLLPDKKDRLLLQGKTKVDKNEVKYGENNILDKTAPSKLYRGIQRRLPKTTKISKLKKKYLVQKHIIHEIKHGNDQADANISTNNVEEADRATEVPQHQSCKNSTLGVQDINGKVGTKDEYKMRKDMRKAKIEKFKDSLKESTEVLKMKSQVQELIKFAADEKHDGRKHFKNGIKVCKQIQKIKSQAMFTNEAEIQSYVTQLITPELQQIVLGIIEKLTTYQSRNSKNGGSGYKQRYYTGLREVCRKVKLSEKGLAPTNYSKKIHSVIVSVNIQPTDYAKREFPADLTSLLEKCKAQNVPVIYSHTRKQLARIVSSCSEKKIKSISCLGLSFIDGVNEEHAKMVAMSSELSAEWERQFNSLCE